MRFLCIMFGASTKKSCLHVLSTVEITESAKRQKNNISLYLECTNQLFRAGDAFCGRIHWSIFTAGVRFPKSWWSNYCKGLVDGAERNVRTCVCVCVHLLSNETFNVSCTRPCVVVDREVATVVTSRLISEGCPFVSVLSTINISSFIDCSPRVLFLPPLRQIVKYV